MKSQEQRIEDATRALMARRALSQTDARYIAGIALEAADREPPKWPTEESVRAMADVPEYVREDLRAAFLADPIIKAAIRLRDAYQRPACFDDEIGAVYDAVNEAGL